MVPYESMFSLIMKYNIFMIISTDNYTCYDHNEYNSYAFGVYVLGSRDLAPLS